MDDGRRARRGRRPGAAPAAPSPQQLLLHPRHPEPALVAGHRRRRDVGHLGAIALELERVAGDDVAGHGDRLERRALDGIRRGYVVAVERRPALQQD